jgi:hypothetical protein
MTELKGIYLQCLQCSKEFYARPSQKDSKKFCSLECYYKYKIENYNHVHHDNNCECKQCGKKFYLIPSQLEKPGNHFCSRGCYTSYQARTKIKDNNCVCSTCEKEFYKNPSRMRNRGNNFCSKDCLSQFYAPIKCQCSTCSVEILIPQPKCKSKNFFCSKKCEGAFKTGFSLDGTKIEDNCTCLICGKSFYDFPSSINNGCGKYCSNECKNQSQIGRSLSESTKKKLSIALSGENSPMFGRTHSDETKEKISTSRLGRFCGEDNPNWRGGLSFGKYCKLFNKKFKEEIRNRFYRKCYLCGKTEVENKAAMSVHHIDYFKSSICKGKDWAFVPLCNLCHLKTNSNRHLWFNLLINYWAENSEIHLNDGFGI